MGEPVHPEPGAGRSRAERRRRRERAIARWRQWLSDRDAFLESSLEPGERVIARSGAHPLVTDRRILTARQLRDPSRGRTWVLDPVAFDQIVGWSEGVHHDGRPILRFTHHPLTRITWVPARRFLWWTWDDAVGPVEETTTTLSFGGRTNPVLRAIVAELDRRTVPQGPSFVIRPAGTRSQRLKESRRPLEVQTRAGRISHVLRRATLSIYPGKLAWPIRASSWIVVAALAWLASPWLVLPAIIASELVWIVVMRWSSPGRRTIRAADVDPADQPVP
ncbi:MAG TPA: hypothetical protein VF195_05870 [Actinomycetota bacterium]